MKTKQFAIFANNCAHLMCRDPRGGQATLRCAARPPEYLHGEAPAVIAMYVVTAHDKRVFGLCEEYECPRAADFERAAEGNGDA